MKKLMLALSVAALAWPVASASPADVNALRIHCRTGEDVTVMLDDNPVVRFDGLDLVVSTAGGEISLPSDQTLKINYVKVGSGGVSDTRVSDPVFSFGDGVLDVMNLTPGVTVSVYTVDGRLVSSSATDADGKATLDISGAPGAVYVVQTPAVSFKLRRP